MTSPHPMELTLDECKIARKVYLRAKGSLENSTRRAISDLYGYGRGVATCEPGEPRPHMLPADGPALIRSAIAALWPQVKRSDDTEVLHGQRNA